jgi:dTDP-4-amino-4,6-dideoxygalactose transaminase
MSLDRLSEKLEHAKASGKLPKVVIPVHLCGQPCDMAGIHALGQQYGFKIIEDASHAIGGRYKDKPIGNCRYSDITVFSFHPVKIITSGEGGMALTNSAQLAKYMRLLRSHGLTSDATEMQARDPSEIWNYEQISLGFNYRMTDIHAALGLSQMQRLGAFVTKRHALAQRYDRLLSDLPVTTPWQHADSHSSYHLYVVRLKLGEVRTPHKEAYKAMHAAGILVNLHYIPVYRQPYYEQMGFRPGYCPQAEQYYAEAISIPLYPGLTETEQDHVIKSLKTILLPLST